MLDLFQVSQAVENYKSGQWSLDQFADWLRAASRRKFSESEEVLKALLEIDSLLSQLDFEGLPESSFRMELANTVHPFARCSNAQNAVSSRIFHNQSPRFATAAAAVAFLISVNGPTPRILPPTKMLIASSHTGVGATASLASLERTAVEARTEVV